MRWNNYSASQLFSPHKKHRDTLNGKVEQMDKLASEEIRPVTQPTALEERSELISPVTLYYLGRRGQRVFSTDQLEKLPETHAHMVVPLFLLPLPLFN